MTAADPTDTAGAGGAQASAAETAKPSAAPEADFLRRARENPEWAEGQVKQFQSTADRAEAETKKLVEKIGPIGALLEEFGGETIRAAVENYRGVRNHPDFAEWIPEYERTGQLPTRTGSESNADDGEYKSPEELEMTALREKVASLERDTSANTLASGEQVLKQHMEKVFGEWGLTPEDTETMRSSVTSQIKTWASSGEQGKQAMRTLMSPNGYKTVKGIMLSELSAESLRAAAENIALRKQQGLSGLATDGPSSTSSTGREPPPEFATAIEVARHAKANPDAYDAR